MATISKTVLKKIVAEIIANDEFETDKSGQIVIKTGIYEWSDGSYSDEPEDQVDDEDDDSDIFISDEDEDMLDNLDEDEEDDDDDDED